jgi:hypothetical protein
MPILLYCVSRPNPSLKELPTGVAGSPVLRAVMDSLVAIISRNPDSATWLRASLRSSAVEFHRVITEVFRSAAVVPFRFPTIFENEEQLQQHLHERSGEYNVVLAKFADCAQMEIRVNYANHATSIESGAEYLRERQKAHRAAEDFGAELQRDLSSLSTDWRQRASKSGIRAFAVVDRGRVLEFEAKMRGTLVPCGLNVRVSGPWPVSEFIEQG